MPASCNCPEWESSVGGDDSALGCDYLFDVQAQPLRDAGSVSRISFVEVLDLEFLDALRDGLHAGHNVVNQPLLGVRGHQAEQIPGLRIVIAIGAVSVPRQSPGDGPRPFYICRILRRAAKAIGLVI